MKITREPSRQRLEDEIEDLKIEVKALRAVVEMQKRELAGYGSRENRN